MNENEMNENNARKLESTACSVELAPLGVMLVKVTEIPIIIKPNEVKTEKVVSIALDKSGNIYEIPTKYLNELKTYVNKHNLSAQCICDAISYLWEHDTVFITSVYTLFNIIDKYTRARSETLRIEKEKNQKISGIILDFTHKLLDISENLIKNDFVPEIKRLDELKKETVDSINARLLKSVLFKKMKK